MWSRSRRGVPLALARLICLGLLAAVGLSSLPTCTPAERDFAIEFHTKPEPAEQSRRTWTAGRSRALRRSDRKARLINFSTDNTNIGVELGFTVPLLKVPLQGARAGGEGEAGGGEAGPGMHALNNGLLKRPINVNVGALFVAGSLLLTVMGVVPAVYSALASSAKYKVPQHQHPQLLKRAVDADADADADAEGRWGWGAGGWASGAAHFLTAAESALSRRGVDVWSCGGRTLCGALAEAAERVRRGGGRAGKGAGAGAGAGAGPGPMDRALHGLARSPWLSDWMSISGGGAKLQDAAAAAASREDQEDESSLSRCLERFSRCKLPFDPASLFLSTAAAAAGLDADPDPRPPDGPLDNAI